MASATTLTFQLSDGVTEAGVAQVVPLPARFTAHRTLAGGTANLTPTAATISSGLVTLTFAASSFVADGLVTLDYDSTGNSTTTTAPQLIASDTSYAVTSDATTTPNTFFSLQRCCFTQPM